MSLPSFAGSVRFSNNRSVLYHFRPGRSWEVFVRGRGPTWVHELTPGDEVQARWTGGPDLVVEAVFADDVEAVLES